MLFHHTYMKIVTAYKKESCYVVSIKNVDLVVHKSSAKLIVQMFKICLFNEITIYGEKLIKVIVLTTVVKTYSDLWHDCRKTVNILESDYLQVLFKQDWENTKLSKWIYLLDNKACWLVNKKFDELYVQRWMKWSIQFISFSFSVFIIWKIIIQSDNTAKWKKHVVVNICDLNCIFQPDTYSLSLQTDITSAVQECHYIFTVNYTSFFYQWLINSADQPKFTIILHCDQKHFNIAVMNYWNSSLYVQQ